MMKRPAVFCLVLLALGPTPAALADPVPHLGARGQSDFERYRQAGLHKAFAIAPGGAWSWVADEPSAEAAARQATENCAVHTALRCLPYDLDGRVVLDRREWSGLLGPFLSRREAAAARVGAARGERFPELAFKDGAGRPRRVSDWRGKLLVLHFWASWCAPCRHEMPDLQALRDSLADHPEISFVLLQVREPIAASRQWTEIRKIRLPLFDSGSHSLDDEWLKLADGSRIADRSVASQFPTTLLIDRHGIVLLAHAGPVPRWAEYREFLLDAARRSGR